MLNLTVEQQIDEVVRLRDDNDNNLTFEQIGSKLGISERTARRRYQAGVLNQAVDNLTDEELDDFPSVTELDIKVLSDFIPEDKGLIDRFQPLTRVGDVMMTCDWHIPLHDPYLINCMIETAVDNDIKNLIVAGDYFNMDQLSSYLPHQPEANLETERYDGNLIMKTLLQHFEEVDFIWGNHDFRLSKRLGFKKSFEECMKWMLCSLTEEELKKIRFSELDYMYYLSDVGNSFRICHPQNFSSVPLTVPRALAVKYGCSIFTAHSHHFALGVAPNGRHICIEGGGFFRKDRTEYIQKTNKHHEWVQGYTMFKDGLPHMYSPVIGNITRTKEVKVGG